MANLFNVNISDNEMMKLSKALPPLSEQGKEELRKIENLKKLENYSEQDVREGIISPILRVLGYDKEGHFSFDCNHSIYVLEKRLEYDYNIYLFEKNFWIIEAKKPSVTKGKFRYNELAQALEYSSHPSINVPLVVLCDGHAIEVFDKEENLSAPILRVERQNLIRDFDKIRAILSPLQNWFFQKRRIIRQIDKVLEKEYNSERLMEFEEIVTSRIRSMQIRTSDNYRNVLLKNDNYIPSIESAGYINLIDLHLPIIDSAKAQETVSKTLVRHCRESEFKVLYHMLPDYPRPLSDAYFPNSLDFLIELEKTQISVNWLPSWLKTMHSGNKLNAAIKRLIKFSLTYFRDEEDWKVVLQHAAASRRIAKAMMIISPEMKKLGRVHHIAQRIYGEEFDFSQFVSSPERHLLFEVDNQARKSSLNFLMNCSDKNGKLKSATAKTELKNLWNSEILLLESVENYPEFRKENSLGELHPTEAAAVTYDELGHHALCVINKFPEWKNYVLNELIDEVHKLASMGSWQAKKFLQIEVGSQYAPAPESEIANRFFFGDTNTLRRLRALYGI